MPIDRGYTMVQIRESGRDLLRTLAYKRRKPMYEVLEDVLRETLNHDEKNQKESIFDATATLPEIEQVNSVGDKPSTTQ